MRFIQEKNRSALIQKLLIEYWERVEEEQNRKKKKKKELVESEKGENKEYQNSIRNSDTPSLTLFNVRGV